MRESTIYKVERFFPSWTQAPTMEAAVEAFLDVFQTGFESLKSCLKNKFYIIIKHVLTELAYNEALGDLFDQSIELWRQLSVSAYVSAHCALTSSRFVSPVAMFIHDNPEERSEIVDRAKDPPDPPFAFLQVDSSSCHFSGDDEHCKHTKKKHLEHVRPNYLAISLRDLEDC